jgi:hypothetical protein
MAKIVTPNCFASSPLALFIQTAVLHLQALAAKGSGRHREQAARGISHFKHFHGSAENLNPAQLSADVAFKVVLSVLSEAGAALRMLLKR